MDSVFIKRLCFTGGVASLSRLTWSALELILQFCYRFGNCQCKFDRPMWHYSGTHEYNYAQHFCSFLEVNRSTLS